LKTIRKDFTIDKNFEKERFRKKMKYRELVKTYKNHNLEIDFYLKFPELEIFHDILSMEKNSLLKIFSRKNSILKKNSSSENNRKIEKFFEKYSSYLEFLEIMTKYLDDCLNVDSNIFDEKIERRNFFRFTKGENIYEMMFCNLVFPEIVMKPIYQRAIHESDKKGKIDENIHVKKDYREFFLHRKMNSYFQETTITLFDVHRILEEICTHFAFWTLYEKKLENSKNVNLEEMKETFLSIFELFNEICNEYSKIQNSLDFDRKSFRKIFFVLQNSYEKVFSKKMNWKILSKEMKISLHEKELFFFDNFDKNFFEEFLYMIELWYDEKFSHYGNFSKNRKEVLHFMRTFMKIFPRNMKYLNFQISMFFLESFIKGHISKISSFLEKENIPFSISVFEGKRKILSSSEYRKEKIISLRKKEIEKREKRNQNLRHAGFLHFKSKHCFDSDPFFNENLSYCCATRISLNRNLPLNLKNRKENFSKRKEIVKEFATKFLKEFSLYDENFVEARLKLIPKKILKKHISKYNNFSIYPEVGKKLFRKKYRYKINLPDYPKIDMNELNKFLLKTDFEIVKNKCSETLFFNVSKEEDFLNFLVLCFDSKKIPFKIRIRKRILSFEL
jgi:hypothetical protein